VGCGGVGLSAIQGAVVAGARRIIAVDSQPAKFDLARALGATDCVDASAGDAVGQVMELTSGGVDYSFEAIGLKATVEQCFEMLRPGGVATLIGIAIGQRAEFDVTMLLFGERKVQGSAMGSNRFRTDLPNFIELDQRGRIDLGAMIDEHIALGQINEGYEAMRRGAINGRKVIMFG
jgi:S-(hydroxymethyl)glutathione dehydrogenase/alcohol dehydrogenase